MAEATTSKVPSTYYKAFCWSCKRETYHQLEGDVHGGSYEVCKDPKHDHSKDHGNDD